MSAAGLNTFSNQAERIFSNAIATIYFSIVKLSSPQRLAGLFLRMIFFNASVGPNDRIVMHQMNFIELVIENAIHRPTRLRPWLTAAAAAWRKEEKQPTEARADWNDMLWQPTIWRR